MIEAVLFDIDGTLITTGGAGAIAWRRAFEELHGAPLDIREVTESGMTDPEVGRVALRNILGRDPDGRELATAMAHYLRHLSDAIDESDGYRVMPGIEELLERLVDDGHLLGLTTGNIEAAAHIKLARAGLNRFFSFGGYGSDSNERAELTRSALERGKLVSGGALDRRRQHLRRRHPPRRSRRPRRRHRGRRRRDGQLHASTNSAKPAPTGHYEDGFPLDLTAPSRSASQPASVACSGPGRSR